MRAATYFSARPCSKGLSVFLASSACQPSATSYHSCSAAPLPWPSGFSWAAHVFKAGRSLLAFGSNSAVKRTASPPLTLAVSLLSNRFIQPMLFLPAFTFSSIYPLGFCRVPGFALGCCASFKRFWPLALVQQAPPAIIFQAVRRLRGALLFRGLRPSSIQKFLFLLLWLTGQSSRPAFGRRLTFFR